MLITFHEKNSLDEILVNANHIESIDVPNSSINMMSSKKIDVQETPQEIRDKLTQTGQLDLSIPAFRLIE